MPKSKDVSVAILALTALSFWLFVALPIYYGKPHSSEPNKCSKEQSDHHGFWEKTDCDPTAYFTLWLVGFTGVLGVSTIGLWWVTWRGSIRQSRDMEASIAVANRSAAISERVLIELERPWIFVFGAKVVGPDVYNEWYIEYTVANYGKMPAIISKVNNGIEISEKVEPAWPLEAVEGNSLVDAPILASGEQRTIRELIPVQEAEKGSVAYRTTQTESGEQTIEAIPLYNTPTGFDSFFIVKIDYRGPKSIGHGTAACWLYMPPYDLLVRGGEDYNYTS